MVFGFGTLIFDFWFKFRPATKDPKPKTKKQDHDKRLSPSLRHR